MAAIETVTLEVPDPTAADAFELGPRIGVRASAVETTGFRGFTMSLVVSQPSTVDSLIGTALDTGSHRIVIGGDAGPFTDPDGFVWEPDLASRPDM